MKCRRVSLLGVSLSLIAVLALKGRQRVRVLWEWRTIERIEFDTAEAREQLVPMVEREPITAPEPIAEPTPVPTFQATEYDTVLAIGNDFESASEQENVYADPI